MSVPSAATLHPPERVTDSRTEIYGLAPDAEATSCRINDFST